MAHTSCPRSCGSRKCTHGAGGRVGKAVRTTGGLWGSRKAKPADLQRPFGKGRAK